MYNSGCISFSWALPVESLNRQRCGQGKAIITLSSGAHTYSGGVHGMEVLAFVANSILAVIVYGFIAGLCFHTLVSRHSNRLVESFLSMAGLISLVIVAIHILNLFGLLPSPLPPLVSGNIITGIGGVVGLAAWIIRNALTRPR